MNGLFPEERFRNPAANEIWKRSEVDRLLELYLGGSDLGRIAVQLERNRKAVVRKLQEYIYNERQRVVNYKPRLRTSRQGKRITPNEQQIIRECLRKKVPVECIARLLARDATEITGPPRKKGPGAVPLMRQVAPTLDLIWAYRYAYFGWKQPIISDAEYNALVAEEVEYGGGAADFLKIKLHHGWPDRIKSLALYLSDTAKQKPVNPSKQMSAPSPQSRGSNAKEPRRRSLST